MGIKQYIHHGGELHTTVTSKEKQYRIHFEQVRGGAVFMTGDIAIQRAIEADARFNRKFSLCYAEDEPDQENTVSVEDHCKEELVNQRIVEEVENISQAREYLKKAGICGQALRTPEAIIRKAAEAGISFPHLSLKSE